MEKDLFVHEKRLLQQLIPALFTDIYPQISTFIVSLPGWENRDALPWLTADPDGNFRAPGAPGG